MNKMQDQGRLSTVEKASYGVLGFGRNLSSQMVLFFMMFFYTDVFEIPVHFLTAMLFIFSIWEVCSKQLAGFFMGKTQSRYGKYRPFLLWTLAPYAVFSTAMFIAPNLSVPYKILYACSTYFIWVIVNNTLSIAHNSLLPMMSQNQLERTQINSLKIIFSVLASIVVTSSALKLVDVMGRGNQQEGFVLTVLGMCLIAIPIQYFSFKNIKEKYPTVEEKKISAKVAIRCLADRRLILFFLAYGMFWLSCTFKNQSTTYYIKYVLGQPEYIGFFFMVGTTSSFIMHFFIRRIVYYIKIEKFMFIGILGSLLGIIVMCIAESNLLLLSIGNIVFGLMSAIPANLIYVVLAGYVDEKNNQYKTNLGSWLYSSMDNLAKIGIGIGGAVFSHLLYVFGYNPNLQQTPSALLGIRLGFSGGTGIAMLACLFLMGFYISACNKRVRNKTAEIIIHNS